MPCERATKEAALMIIRTTQILKCTKTWRSICTKDYFFYPLKRKVIDKTFITDNLSIF